MYGVLLEVRNAKFRAGSQNTMRIPLKIKDDSSLIGHTYATVNDVRAWTTDIKFSWLDEKYTYNEDTKKIEVEMIKEYPKLEHKAYTNSYVKTEYENGSIKTGTHSGGYTNGNTILITGASQSITITPIIGETGETKTNYDLEKNETTVTYKVVPNLFDYDATSPSGITGVTVFVEVTIPKGLTYIAGSGNIGEPQRTSNADGSTKLVWELYGCTVGQAINAIQFSAKIDEETANGVQYEVNAVIAADEDKVGNTDIKRRTATASIQVTNLASHRLYKETMTPVVEVNGTIKYKITYLNKTDFEIPDFQLLDVLPYNGDDRGSKFDGTYKIKNIEIKQIHLGSEIANDNLSVYISNSEEARKATSKDTGWDSNSIWNKIEIESLEEQSASAFVVLGHVGAQTTLEINIDIQTYGNKPNDIYRNVATAQIDEKTDQMTSTVVDATPVKRLVEGTVWYDKNGDGLMNNNEPKLQGKQVTLLNVDGTLAKDIDGHEIPAVETNEDGYYKFEDMERGNYKIKVDVAIPYEITLKKVGSNAQINSKFNPNCETDELTELNSLDSPSITISNLNAGLKDIKTSVEAIKIWNDKDNVNGKRPKTIRIVLKKGNEELDVVEIDETYAKDGDTNKWSYTFENLNKYEEDGTEITYTVEEKEVISRDLYFYETKIEGKTITNTFSVPADTIDIEITKKWEDETNRLEKRPEQITVQVKNGSKVEQEHTLTELDVNEENQNEWKYTFKGLTKYDEGGNEINYTIEEVGDIKGYTKQVNQDDKTITNTVKVHKITTEVIEHEEKGENVKGGKITGETDDFVEEVVDSYNSQKDIIVEADNGYEIKYIKIYNKDDKGNITNPDAPVIVENVEGSLTKTLEKFQNVTENKHIVVEFQRVKGSVDATINKVGTTEITDKSSAVNYSIQYGATIKFYKGLATITIIDTLPYEIDETKPWDIEDGNYDKATKTIKWVETREVDTYVEPSQECQLNITKNISLSFKDIDVTAGKLINTVEGTINIETADELKKESTCETAYNFKKQVTVTKVWQDNEIQRLKRPNSVVLILKNGEIEIARKELTETNKLAENDNVWTYTFDDLEKYNNDGSEIEYTIEEEEKAKGELYFYEKKIEGTTVTNIFQTPKDTTQVIAEKIWDDNDNKAQKRPTSIKLELTGDGNTYTYILTKADKIEGEPKETWRHTFTELPKYNNNGEEIQYNLEEKEITEGDLYFYQSSKVETTITNTFVVPDQTVDVPVTKIWNDNANRAGKRPNSIVVEVRGNGNVYTQEIEGGKTDGVWSYTFKLPKYDENGNEIQYTVQEISSAYFYETTQSGTTITNTFVVPNERVQIPVTKIWKDDGNKAGKRPSRVVLELTGNGRTYKETITGNMSASEWKYVFTNLPKYDSNGNEIKYKVTEKEENENELYFYETSQNGFNITNTFRVPNDRVQLSITKKWEDNNNELNLRPKYIVVVIEGTDGSLREKLIQGNEKTDEGWNYTYDLPKYDDNGNEIQYLVKEEGKEYYDAEINGTEITNTLKKHKITTEVRTSASGEKGGTITGEGEDPYEEVVHKKDSQKDIVVMPSYGYKVKSIEINEQSIYFETNEDNSVKIDKFTGMVEDKHIVVEFERIKGKVEVHYKEKGTNTKLEESEKIEGYVGNNFKTEEKHIEFYNLVEIEGNTEGKIEEKTQKVTYYYEKKQFNLKIDKQVESLIVNGENKGNNLGDSEKLLKVEIEANKQESAEIIIKYLIEITNIGEIPGKINKLIDYLPEGLEFKAQDNPNWTTNGNNVENKELYDVEIQPGEKMSVGITLRWKNGEYGEIENIVAIQGYTNEPNFDDVDPTDNESQTSVILSIKTGTMEILYIIQLIIALSIIAVVIKYKKSQINGSKKKTTTKVKK